MKKYVCVLSAGLLVCAFSCGLSGCGTRRATAARPAGLRAGSPLSAAQTNAMKQRQLTRQLARQHGE